MTLGERIRELRLHHKLTLKRLGQCCHISVSYLSEIERDLRYPSLEALQSIASTFGLTIGEVLLDVDEWGEATMAALAPGLVDLTQDALVGDEITPAWLSLLGRIELDGKRPQTKREWLEIYLHLKRILEKAS